MKKNSLTLSYACIQGFYWMAFAAIGSFCSAYLLDAGFNSTTIGVLIAAAGVSATLLQPVFAAYADRPAGVSLRVLLIGLALLNAGLSLLLLLNHNASRLLSWLLYWLLFTMIQVMQPLVNSLGMICINRGIRINFGAARATGSTTYGLLAWLLGAIMLTHGSGTVPLSMLLSCCLLGLFLFLFPFRKDSEPKNDPNAHSVSGSPTVFFKKHPRFGLMLIGMILMYISHVLLNNFTIQIIGSKGGGSAEMGVAVCIAALLELPIMFLFDRIAQRISSRTLVRIAPFFFFLKILFALLVTSVIGYYLSQGFQMFGYALFYIASVYYVNDLMDEEDAVKGQAYAAATYTAGSVAASLIGGRLIDAAGVDAMLIFGILAAGLGAAIIFIFAEDPHKNQTLPQKTE